MKTINVTNSRPKIGGAVRVAPLGTALPEDAVSELDAAFKSLGYISEDGLKNQNSPERGEIKAWGGDTVLMPQEAKKDTFSFALIEALNIDVLKFVYGEENVTGTLDTGITIDAVSDEQPPVVMVIDMIMANKTLKRIVIPEASVAEVGEISYTNSDAVGYETTINAAPTEMEDGKVVTHREYIKKSAAKPVMARAVKTEAAK